MKERQRLVETRRTTTTRTEHPEQFEQKVHIFPTHSNNAFHSIFRPLLKLQLRILSPNMCVHTRLVYTCGHFGWADELRPCNTQMAFLTGLWAVPCDMMHSHPLKTFKIQRECNRCNEKRKKTAKTRLRVKAMLEELNESVQRLKQRTGK